MMTMAKPLTFREKFRAHAVGYKKGVDDANE